VQGIGDGPTTLPPLWKARVRERRISVGSTGAQRSVRCYPFRGVSWAPLAQAPRRLGDRMRRRTFLLLLTGTPLGFMVAHADQPTGKVPHVGILSLANDPGDPRWEAFRGGLHELGYMEGQNIALEYRFARGDFTVLKQMTEELANLTVDVIMVDGVASGQTAAAVIRTTPIIIAALGADPIALGLADSLARPGRNVTGFTITAPELAVKRVDLLSAAFPTVKVIAVLLNPSKAGAK
jgi:putative ABC transport system substrate-binding protein